MINAAAETSSFATATTLARRNFRPADREAAFLTIAHSNVFYVDRLLELRTGRWNGLLQWLDVSGLALYFADTLAELNVTGSLPAFVTDRLQQNIADNSVRMRGLLEECASIQGEFERQNLVYAVLKGFSLYPSSVPKLELRHQLDLDFVVDERCAREARRALERHGYRLYAISGRSWEFKKDEVPRFSTRTMYKVGFGQAVELHIQPARSAQSLVNRIEHRTVQAIRMPTLSPADLFLDQALHLFKDLCSPFLRASHLLELYRHLGSRCHERGFWIQVRSLIEKNASSATRLGVSLGLSESLVGIEIPQEIAASTTHDIPVSVRRWLMLYGPRSIYGTPPGSKLYLILQRELESIGVPFARPLSESILPLRLPGTIIPASRHETLSFRTRRYLLQLRFILMRMRFHTVEGIRYGWECFLWKRRSAPSR